MTEPHERALVQILAAWAALTAIVTDRIIWDSEEIDVTLPAITLRLLAGTPPARDLGSRGGVRRCLVELSAHAATGGASSSLLDVVIDALTPYEAGEHTVAVSGSEVRFGAIHLDDVQQTQPARERSYRKAARFVVWVYE
jgi:hypothetical protein